MNAAIVVWYLVIFGQGWDASSGSIPTVSRERCIQQANWLNSQWGSYENNSVRVHAFCVEGAQK